MSIESGPLSSLLRFDKSETESFLLMSEVRGSTIEEYIERNRRSARIVCECVEKAALPLRSLHSLPVASCSLRQDVKTKLIAARRNIERGFVVEDDFDEQHTGRTPRDIYRELLDKRPPREDPVFTHGDPCLTNLMIDNKGEIGFVDLERGGIADRYQDIALILGYLREYADTAQI
jgi:aminoglycoside phosphotransferase